MDKKVIYVTFFKKLVVKYNDVVVESKQIKSEKLVKLFTYLLLNYQRIVPSSELIDILWRYEDIDNPIGALKNLIYRLRTVLKKEIGLDNLIMTGKASYCISREYTIDMDIYHFEEYNTFLNEKITNEEYYKKCLDLYQGKFLEELNDDYYIVSKSAYYHVIYMSRMLEYACLLEEQQKYVEMELLARHVLDIDNVDERFYEVLIKAMYYQKQYHKAIQTYRTTTDFLYRTLGTKPSKQMMQLFELIKKESHEEGTAITDIRNDLISKNEKGAYLCEYGTFKDLYNMEARMLERLGICAHICLITINDSIDAEGKEVKKEYIEKIMHKVQDALVNGLRIGDVVSRFSVNQFVVLLVSCNFENTQNVMNRVLRKINYSLNTKKISIELSIDEVSLSN